MDLSKAFDIVGHSILHMKLSNYVIKATPLKWFADMNIKLQNVGAHKDLHWVLYSS